MFEVTNEERFEFWKRQGWKDDVNFKEANNEIEKTWDDARIRMAIDLNLA